MHFQDEMIKNWHENKIKAYGKKFQSGILGKVYAKLNEKKCSCEYINNRDGHISFNMLIHGNSNNGSYNKEQI